MTLIMYDSVDISTFPSDGKFFAGYVDGDFADYTVIKSRFPQADILSIAVFAEDNAECLDIETGDAAPEEAAAWVTRQISLGVERPCLYADASEMIQVINAMNAAGVPRSVLRLWSAHYTGEAHICGPSSCGALPESADGTQWTDNANGLDLDESLLLDDFFGKSAPPAVTYLTTAEMETIMNLLPELKQGMSDTTLPHWYIHRLQAILNVAYGSGLAADGVYGAATAAAVRTVQGKLGLVQDGVCGPATWARTIGG